ncbi:MAG: cytochrome c maturation protein CcmE [Bernardetiaceae bacterium]|nr:cytochrome c maturation protein CcmE [Bernardetiaceae bacterium]
MKYSVLIVIAVLAISVGMLMSTSQNVSSYVDFDTAFELASEGENAKVHVVGELLRDAQGNITGIEYNPLQDANFIAFALKDEKGRVHRVISRKPPPSMQDFKRSEKVVIVGKVEGENFVAHDILLKCPSKYEENEL